MTELLQAVLNLGVRWNCPPELTAVLFTALLVAVVHICAGYVLPALARRSTSDLDDRVIGILERPAIISAVLIGGLAFLMALRQGGGEPHEYVRAAFATLALIYWAVGLGRAGDAILSGLSREGDKDWVQARTLPLLRIVTKVVVGGGAVYGVCLAWGLDLTAWVASAGIMGIAVGFAAKDTLSNLFAGLFILVDAPYKIGDYLVLESGERGYVTEIGMRTTRLMTRDDIQIIVPNAVMANSKIVNETGGNSPQSRIRCQVGVAYGSDVDQVRALLLELALACPEFAAEPEPRVRFRSLGESSLDFELLGWIAEPALRGRVLDDLYTQIYKRLNTAGIEIPYPKRDVYLHTVAPEVGQ